MKKIMLVMALTAMVFLAQTSLYAQSKSANPDYYRKVPPMTVKTLLAAPAATGTTAFEFAAAQFNKWVDQQMANVPKNQRPYADAPTIARICDSLVKSYRSGNTAMAVEIASRIPFDMTVEEKMSFLETITNAYLAAEGKKK